MAFLVCLLFRESIGVAITKSFVIFVRKFFVSSHYMEGSSCIAIRISSLIWVYAMYVIHPYPLTLTLTPVTGSGGVASIASASATAQLPKEAIVQFKWQPLTEMSYPKVTLLGSFKVGGSIICS